MGNWSKRRSKTTGGHTVTRTISGNGKVTNTVSNRVGGRRVTESRTSDGKSRTTITEYNPFLGTRRTVKDTTNKNKVIKSKKPKPIRRSRSSSGSSGPIIYTDSHKSFFKIGGFVLLCYILKWSILGF